jgi:hypothetical protein
MSYRSATQPNDIWTERISREIDAIHQLGYRCELRRDHDGRGAYVIVHLHRDTEEGQQPVTLYLRLDAGFPETRPEMLVAVALPAGQSGGAESREAPVESESKARMSWRSDSMLYQIVREVQDNVQGDQLRLVGAPSAPGAAPAAPPLPAAPAMLAVARPPRRQSARGVIAAVLLGGALLLFGGAAALYLAFFYDPCGGDQQLAQRDLATSDTAALKQATQTLEQLRRRGQTGEGGSCAALAGDPRLLRDAYLRYGQQLLAGGSLDGAEQAYQRARQLDPTSRSAQQGLDAVVAARVRPLWSDATNLQRAGTVEGWSQVVEALERIRAISPDAISPNHGISITLELYRAQIAWGDLLYAQERADAAGHYAAARALLPADLLAAERLNWIERRRRLREAQVADWPALLEELQRLVDQSPTLADPAGRSVGQWLYAARVGYAQALLAQEPSGPTAEAALQQAQAALDLAGGSDDSGAAARLAEQQAIDRLRVYNLVAEPLDAEALSKVLRERNLPERQNGRPVNLLVLTPTANMALTLSGPQETQQLVSSRAGVAFAALDADAYRLSLGSGAQASEVALDYSRAAAYLVRVTPR